MTPDINSIIGPAIGGIIAGSVGLIVNNSNQNHQKRMEERRRKWENFQQKKQIRSRLFGIKFFMVNICYQRGYSLINKYSRELLVSKTLSFIEAAPEEPYNVNNHWKVPSKKEIKEDSSENKRLAEKETDYARKYASDFAIASKDLWEIIGLIQVSFDNTIDERDILINELETAISDYNTIAFNPSEFECENPNKWSKDKHDEIKKCLDDKIIPAFKNLLDFLKSDIDKDKEDIEKMDKFIKNRCYRICKFFCNP